MLILIISEQEPAWVTLIAVVVFFFFAFLFVIPNDLEKSRKADEEYARRKGITVEELRELRNKRRARSIRGSVRKDVMKRDNYQCQYCGSNQNLVIDHIFPFSRGGSNDADNLQVLCNDCNSSKGASIPDEFVK